MHRIPLSSIFEAQPHLDRLARMGIRDLGPVLKLPRAGLRQRFGAAFVGAIEAALGERADPRQAIHAPAIFEQGLELALPTDSKGLIETGCLRLLEEGLAWLAGMQSAVTEYRFVFHQGRRQSQELCIGLAEPSREASRIQRLLGESLSQTALTAAVSGIALRLDNPLPLAHQNEELFPQSNPARENQGIQELCERLSARLGQSQVLRIQEIRKSTHSLERESKIRACSQVPHTRSGATHGQPTTAAHLATRVPRGPVCSEGATHLSRAPSTSCRPRTH
jgi:protein ImuB